jgi:hypothetical protein
MYKDEQRAILMTKNHGLREKILEYLYQRYNLDTEAADDILEVSNKLAADNSADSSIELVIFDETVEGLPTTAQALKTLKSKYTHVDVLYLSTILEIAPPYRDIEMEMLSEYSDEEYRAEQIDRQMDKIIELLTPITKAKSLTEVYQLIPKTMVKVYQADWAICSVLRLDEKPVRRGVAASDFPPVLEAIPYEYPLKGTGYLEDMLTYYKPIHIPDLEKDEPFCRELEEKFSRRYRSALLMPMHHDGHYIGFLGMFTRNRDNLYLLPDLDILQRLADMATVAIITHFYREHSDLDMDKIEEDAKKINRGDDTL